MVTLTLRPLVVEFIREEQFEMKSAYCPKCHRVGGKVGHFCVPCRVALEPHEKPEEQHEEATAADRIGYLMGFDGPTAAHQDGKHGRS